MFSCDLLNTLVVKFLVRMFSCHQYGKVWQYLHVGASMAAMAEGREGISSRCWVEVRTSRDGILPRVGRTAVTESQVIFLEVVVPENTRTSVLIVIQTDD